MALIRGIENANKHELDFCRLFNGGLTEGVFLVCSELSSYF